uniref:MADS-box domain-containing protein n=1 Tax=Oryza meridionalis TaxID=40149 RepID=A0A0E0F8A7_9ORYZ
MCLNLSRSLPRVSLLFSLSFLDLLSLSSSSSSFSFSLSRPIHPRTADFAGSIPTPTPLPRGRSIDRSFDRSEQANSLIPLSLSSVLGSTQLPDDFILNHRRRRRHRQEEEKKLHLGLSIGCSDFFWIYSCSLCAPGIRSLGRAVISASRVSTNWTADSSPSLRRGDSASAMGRVKLKIKKLENSGGRHVTYSKRRSGILKKAKELSILCDIPLILLMFSPNDKPTICVGDHSSIEDVITKYAQQTPQERAKRKLESLEALKKTFKKLDHDVNIQDFLGSGGQTVEELSSHLGALQCQMADVEKRLSYWSDPEKVENIDHIRAMEQSLKESLNRIRIHKENFAKQHLMSLQCAAAQFQNDMQLPLGLTGDPNTSSWFHGGGGAEAQQPMMLPEDPSLLHQRDIGCSASTSLQSYPGYFSMGKQSTDNAGGGEQHHHAAVQQQQQQPEFSQADCLTSLQLGAQFPYPSAFDNAGLLSDRLFDNAAAAMDFGSHYDLPRPGDEASFQNWASAACGATMYDHHQQQQQQQQPAQPSMT